MEDLASMRYKIINSMVKTFIEQEKKFFERCFSLINNFFNNMYCLEQNLPYQKSSYDPMKYTRAGKIMEGVDANSLPEIKMKDKYSNNDNKTNNIQRANSCLNNISSNIGNNNNLINKKFSFEDYKMRKSLDNSNRNNNNNNINNINNYSNSIKEDNNKNDNQNNNPYSYEAYKRRTQSLGNNKRPQINNNNNNNNNYYNNNLNIVMNSIIGEENTLAKNPFNDNTNNNRKNPYSSNFNNSNNNPFENINNIHNPYSNIFNSSSNNNNNNINNMFNSAFGNKGTNQQNNNDNKRYRKPQGPYNFGF